MLPLPPLTSVPIAKAKEMLAEVPHVVDAKLSRYAVGTVYALDDGRAVVFHGGRRATVVDSRDALLEWFEERRRSKKTSPSRFMQLVPQGAAFPAHVPQLVRNLPGILRVREDGFDVSLESLTLLDRTVRRFKADELLQATMFPHVLAYVGEVIRRGVDGVWWMRRTNVDWEPWILDSEGRGWPLGNVEKEILEHLPKQSLHSLAAVALNRQIRWYDMARYPEADQ